MREPDALDSLRVLALGILAFVGSFYLPASREIRLLALEASLAVLPLAYARVAGLRPLHSQGFRRIGRRQVLLLLLAALGSMWILKGIVDLQNFFFSGDPNFERQTRQFNESVEDIRRRTGLLGFALLGILPAFCEEPFFRGILFRGLARSWGSGAALAVTAVLFSLAHAWPVQAATMLFAGLYFGLVVWLTGSLWAGVLAHAINNLAVLVSYDLFKHRLYEVPSPWWMVLLSVVVYVLALALLAMERRGGAGAASGTRR